MGRRLAGLFHNRPRLQAGSLLAAPLGWLVIGYLGSLAVLLVSAFWSLGELSGHIEGTTLDGEPVSLADFRGSPVIVNFWGPSCIPCREEFPLFSTKLQEHADDGLVVLGVLMDDPPEPARDFVAEYDASWPTVIDPGESIQDDYLTLARPTSYFIDGDGILQSIQIGELRDEDFERQYELIAP